MEAVVPGIMQRATRLYPSPRGPRSRPQTAGMGATSSTSKKGKTEEPCHPVGSCSCPLCEAEVRRILRHPGARCSKPDPPSSVTRTAGSNSTQPFSFDVHREHYCSDKLLVFSWARAEGVVRREDQGENVPLQPIREAQEDDGLSDVLVLQRRQPRRGIRDLAPDDGQSGPTGNSRSRTNRNRPEVRTGAEDRSPTPNLASEPTDGDRRTQFPNWKTSLRSLHGSCRRRTPPALRSMPGWEELLEEPNSPIPDGSTRPGGVHPGPEAAEKPGLRSTCSPEEMDKLLELSLETDGEGLREEMEDGMIHTPTNSPVPGDAVIEAGY